MGFAALLLVAASAQAPHDPPPPQEDHGAPVETANVSVSILRSAVLKNGVLASAADRDTPRAQRHSERGRVSYTFE